jgi:hypothetical protein
VAQRGVSFKFFKKLNEVNLQLIKLEEVSNFFPEWLHQLTFPPAVD